MPWTGHGRSAGTISCGMHFKVPRDDLQATKVCNWWTTLTNDAQIIRLLSIVSRDSVKLGCKHAKDCAERIINPQPI
jgi:hypothetical protein